MKLGISTQHVSGHCWRDFQGHGVKGQGHARSSVEILRTRELANRWKDLNQNLPKYLLHLGDEMIKFSRSWG